MIVNKSKLKNIILFIDSGLGGMSILKHYSQLNPESSYIYYADTINFPYGEKNEETISNYLLSIYNRLSKEFNIILIVIACNTASVSALEFLRKRVDIPIVGTVPPVKPASEITKNNRIGIIATNTTVKLNYLQILVNKFAYDKNVFIRSAPGLVEAVEKNFSEDDLNMIIEKELSYFKKVEIDTLVLGCTHYFLIKDHIENFLGNNVTVLDSSNGVSNRIISLIPEKISWKINKNTLVLSYSNSEILNNYKNWNKKLQLFQNIKIRDYSCQKV